MKNFFLPISIICILIAKGNAQQLSSMKWFNEPKEWSIKNNQLSMQVTPQSDYWNKTYYGFTVNDGPFLYTERGGEFEVIVRINGNYKTRFDQMGLMLKVDENHWIKMGIEYVDGVYNFSTVHTINQSSWSVVSLNEKPKEMWVKAIRRSDSVEIFYSTDGKKYTMSNIVYFPEYKTVQVGLMAASPDGNGFLASFDNFAITHLADKRRLEWLKDNQ